MKKISIAFLLLLTASFAFAQQLDVMSYNIRYGNETDGENAWSKRKEHLVALLNYYAPAVFGTQEGLQYQLEYIKENSSYNYVGVGRDNGKTEGEYTAIFYNEDQVNFIAGNTFWLSETPNKPSKAWDAALNRICTYALFETKDEGKKFWVFNAHFDHVGVKAREESSKLILKKIAEINTKNYPVVLTGDLNLTPETTAIQIITKNLQDSYTHSELAPYGPTGTFSGYDTNSTLEKRIDYVFTSTHFKVQKYRTVADMYNHKYPSDHLPVLVTIAAE